MSALVLTILICVAWAAMGALGYLRGGWREVVTLAAILLAYAVASEWAAPNGRDLAAVFGGNTYRSTTTIGLAYLFGGVALFGYFGGTRLPRPIPLSATERFIGGAVGLLNGGVLAALALRIVRSSAFGPGDGIVLQEATLARLLISQAGYLLLVGLIGAILASFLSLLLVRQPPYAAEYQYMDTEDPMLQQSPAFGYFPDHREEMAHTASPQPQPQPSMYAAPYALQAAPGMPTQFVPALAPDPAFAPPGTATTLMPVADAGTGAREVENAPVSLMPATPMLPRAVPVPMWPTPSLPVTTPATAIAPTMTVPGTSGQAARAAATETLPDASGSVSAQSSGPTGPPGFAITASQPLPMANDAPAATPAAMSPKPLAPAPALPAPTIGPTPFTATTTRVAGEPPAARGNETNAAYPNAVPAPAPISVADTAIRTDVGAESEGASVDASAPPTPNARPIVPMPTSMPISDLIPAVPLLPRVPEMPDSTNLTPFFAQPPRETAPAVAAPAAPVADAPDTTAPSATPVRISRARVATARAPEPRSSPTPSGTGQSAATNVPMPASPPTPQHPAQPGPNMHPCPVCEYPVRNGARFCPNCGSAQSRT